MSETRDEVLLAGEGHTELGGWALPEPYRRSEPGVLEALLRKMRPDGWRVADAVVWKTLRHYRLRSSERARVRDGDALNVLRLALIADRHPARPVLVFVRDRDRDVERDEVIEGAIEEARARHPTVRVIGGVAIRTIEAWVLALRGERRSEDVTDPKRVLRDASIESTEAMVDVVEGATLDAVPSDARSLHRWLERARAWIETS